MRLLGIGYKSLIIVGALTLFALPASAATLVGHIDYTENQNDPGNSLSFSLTSYLGTACNASAPFNTDNNQFDSGWPVISFAGASNGDTVGDTRSWNTPDGNVVITCYLIDEPNNFDSLTLLKPIIDGSKDFNITEILPVAFTTPTSTAGNLLAAISDQFADPGFLTFAILAASIVLGFWGMEKLLALMPKDKT